MHAAIHNEQIVDSKDRDLTPERNKYNGQTTAYKEDGRMELIENHMAFMGVQHVTCTVPWINSVEQCTISNFSCENVSELERACKQL